jgi:hypothetical protein
MDSAHRKMDRISFQPLHWDNRQAATGRFFFLSISLPFFHIYRDQTRDRWGGKPIDDPLPQHNSSSLIILHFFSFMCTVNVLCLSALVRLLLFRALLSEISVHSLLTFFFFYLFCGYLQSINCGPFHLTSYIQRRPSPIDSCCAPSGRINAPRRRPYIIIRSHLCFNFIRYSFSRVLHRRALFE